MAMNPPLNEIGEPCRVSGEHFILQRKGISFEVKVKELGKMKGDGIVIQFIIYVYSIYYS